MADDTAARVEVLLAHLHDAVLMEDEDRKILYVNVAFLQMFGVPLSAEQMLGMDCAAMAEQSAQAFARPARFLDSVREALDAKEKEVGRVFLLADGRYLERDYVPMFDQGHYAGHLWLYRDVTEAVRGHEETRTSEANLRAIVDNAQDPVWSVDQRLSLLTFNRAFGTLSAIRTGWVPVQGGPVALSIAERPRERELRAYHEALRGMTVDFEIEVRDETGALQVFEVNLAPILDGQEVRGVTAATRDVSSARRTSELLRRAKNAAETANRAKSDFLAHISHEIRTPLNAVIGMVDLALDTRLDARQRSYLATAQRNSEALLTLLTDILDFSKIEAGEMDLERVPFSPREVVEDVVSFLAGAAAAKGLALSFSARTVPGRIVGDPNRYRQVAMNLVGNAIKYTTTGSVDVLLHGAPGVDGQVVVAMEVTDTGRGIAPEDHERVFSRFFRTRDSGRASGTGLGLSITASLVQLMGGTVELRSKVGRGSTFRAAVPVRPLPHHDELVFSGRAVVARHSERAGPWAAVVHELGFDTKVVDSGAALLEALLADSGGVELVVAEAGLPGPDLAAVLGVVQTFPGQEAARWVVLSDDAELPQIEGAMVMHGPLLLSQLRGVLVGPAAEGVDLRRGARVLVAEDHPDSREMMVNLLRRAGHDAIAVSDGQAGWDLLQHGGFELALVDMDMPAMDGLALTRAVRDHEEALGLARLPIVLVSGHATEEHRGRAREAGVDAFVPKPINRRRLMDVMDQCLDLRPVVLVADDAPDARRLLHTWFLAAGARVVEAAHGEEVLDRVERHEPDVVVLDMQMPVMSGFEAAEALRRRGCDLPIVGLTGETGREARKAVLRAGCTSYLAKPCRRQELLDAVAGLLWHGTEVDSSSGHSLPPVLTQAPLVVRPTPPTNPRRGGLDDDLGELVPLYLDERAADVDALTVAVEASAWEEVRRRGHRMKGTAVPYGFPEIGVLGAALETAAKAEDAAAASAAVERLDQLVRAARTTSRGSTSP